eukprot:scaffold5079_cov159-Ochromonas_danica.AAC.3
MGRVSKRTAQLRNHANLIDPVLHHALRLDDKEFPNRLGGDQTLSAGRQVRSLSEKSPAAVV